MEPCPRCRRRATCCCPPEPCGVLVRRDGLVILVEAPPAVARKIVWGVEDEDTTVFLAEVTARAERL